MQLLVEILSSFATLPSHSRAQLGCAEELYLKIDRPITNILSAVLPHVRKSCRSVAVAADTGDLKVFL